MSLTTALNWRYATKRMNGSRIPKEKKDIILNAISLAPTSYGLQPFSIFVIEDKDLLEKIKPIAMGQPQITEASALLVFASWDNVTQERIDAYFDRIVEIRKVSMESLAQVKQTIETVLQNSEADNANWCAKQAYIALGIGLVAAAVEEIDSTPMEGFDKPGLDVLLELKEKGLKSQVLLTLGYRDEANDYLANLKKVRRDKDKLFVTIGKDLL